MKKILLFLAVGAIISTACSPSKEDKAKKLVEESLKKTMKDWSSYEFVEMSKPDSTFTTYFSTSEYDSLSKIENDLELKKIDLDVNSGYPDIYGKTRCREMTDSIPVIEQLIGDTKNKIEIGQKNFKRQFSGWYTKFTYRGNNSLGAKVIEKANYYFDKDITEIVHTSNEGK